MSSPDSSQTWLQIGMELGRIRTEIASLRTEASHHQRSLDTLIRILQEQRSLQPASPAPPPSQRSMLASLLERVSRKVLMDLAIMLAKKIAASALPYIIPWSAFLGGLVWLGKYLLRFLGWT